MNNLKTALWMVVLTLLLVVVGRLVAGTGGMVVALGIAVVMNGVVEERIARLEAMAARAPVAAR